ncbi:MAG: GntR family transcriptional regulator [Proteobacteria bacterium]|nr:GntR family transcriptional regulator [Pseudomonadota bacterium]
MEISWNDKDPIYRQLHDRLVEMILEGIYGNGDSLPSVRQLSADHRINPITVSKAFQLLVDEGVVEKKRGLGMYVMTGAREKLAEDEKKLFLTEEWPRLLEKIARLGLSVGELLEEGEGK